MEAWPTGDKWLFNGGTTCHCVTVDAWPCWSRSSRYSIPGTASAASVSPTTTTGNPGCSDIDSGWSEIKVDNVPAGEDVFGRDPHRHGLERPEPEDLRLELELPGHRSARQGEHITYVYRYDPAVMGDTAMDSPGKYAISHVDWCYGSSDTPPPPPNPCGSADMDSDGMDDSCDNCPSVSNPDQADSERRRHGRRLRAARRPARTSRRQPDTDSDGVSTRATTARA